MNSLFSYDNKVFNFFARILDSLVLAALWLLCSLPVFTVGAASAACYYTYHKGIRKRGGSIFRNYFGSFLANFRQGTVLWLIVLPIGLFLAWDCYLLYSVLNDESYAKTLLIIVGVISVLFIIWALYLFAYIARFENDTKTVMKNCLFIMLAHIPPSISLFCFFAIAVGLTALFLYTDSIFVFLVPVIYFYLHNSTMERVLTGYMSPEDLAAEQDELNVK